MNNILGYVVKHVGDRWLTEDGWLSGFEILEREWFPIKWDVERGAATRKQKRVYKLWTQTQARMINGVISVRLGESLWVEMPMYCKGWNDLAAQSAER